MSSTIWKKKKTSLNKTSLKSHHLIIISKYTTVHLALRCTQWLVVKMIRTYLSTVQSYDLFHERHTKKFSYIARTSQI